MFGETIATKTCGETKHSAWCHEHMSQHNGWVRKKSAKPASVNKAVPHSSVPSGRPWLYQDYLQEHKKNKATSSVVTQVVTRSVVSNECPGRCSRIAYKGQWSATVQATKQQRQMRMTRTFRKMNRARTLGGRVSSDLLSNAYSLEREELEGKLTHQSQLGGFKERLPEEKQEFGFSFATSSVTVGHAMCCKGRKQTRPNQHAEDHRLPVVNQNLRANTVTIDGHDRVAQNTPLSKKRAADTVSAQLFFSVAFDTIDLHGMFTMSLNKLFHLCRLKHDHPLLLTVFRSAGKNAVLLLQRLVRLPHAVHLLLCVDSGFAVAHHQVFGFASGSFSCGQPMVELLFRDGAERRVAGDVVNVI